MIQVLLVVIAIVGGQLYVKADVFPDEASCEARKAQVIETVPSQFNVECKTLESMSREDAAKAGVR